MAFRPRECERFSRIRNALKLMRPEDALWVELGESVLLMTASLLHEPTEFDQPIVDVMTAMTDPIFRPGVRLALGYCLDSTGRVGRLIDQDSTAAVIFTGLVCRNVAAGAASGRAATWPGASPTAPATAYCISKRLGMPYETVRRHMHRLEAKGLCVRAEAGFLVPDEVMFGPKVEQSRAETWAATRQLHKDLCAVGLDLTGWDEGATPNARHRVALLATPYFLNSLSVLGGALGGDLISTIMFLAVKRANTGALDRDPEVLRQFEAADTLYPDNLRAPVTVYQIARVLRLPYETARRHARALVDADLCERDANGRLVVTRRILASPAFTKASEEIWRLTVDFLEAVLAGAHRAREAA